MERKDIDNMGIISNSITALRFPLIILVIFIHTFVIGVVQIDGIVNVPAGKYPTLDLLDYVIRGSIADIAVPTFFFISVFFFFLEQAGLMLRSLNRK